MGPLYFFTSAGPTQNLITSSSRLILFLDYDGTLVPIRRDPARAVLSNGMTEMLHLLLKHRRISVGVVTGRSLSNIKQLVPFKGLFLIANHGFESFMGSRTWVHPGAKKCVPLLKKISRCLQRSLSSIQRVFIENKKYTLTVHYRNASAGEVPFVRKAVKDVVFPYRHSLIITAGKKVLEIRPRFSWGKGHAILRVVQSMGLRRIPVIIYVGDDATDEDAFRVLKKGALTVKVGWSRNTKARYFVHNIAEVKKVLKEVALRDAMK